MKVILTRKGEEILVDDEDFEELNQYTWYLNKGYACRCITIEKKQKKLLMHRVILKLGQGNHGYNELVVDHINQIRHDNRRQNLRVVTHRENIWNQSQQSSGKAGVKGVYCTQSASNPYCAHIAFNGENITLGYFPTAEEAGEAYQEAKRRLHIIGVDPETIKWRPTKQKRRPTEQKRNKGKYLKGVTKDKRSIKNPYMAKISHKGKKTHLGCFPTEELAHQAYLQAKNRLNE